MSGPAGRGDGQRPKKRRGGLNEKGEENGFSLL
jgi:hypothetical protein